MSAGGGSSVSARRSRGAWRADVLATLILVILPLQYVIDAGTEGFWGDIWSGIGILMFILMTLFAGWAIARRRPRLVLGWILLCIPGLFAVFIVANLLGALIQPAAPQAAGWLYLIGGGVGSIETSGNWMLPIGLLFTQLPLRFPDGAPPTPRWRWLSTYGLVSLPAGVLLLDTQSAQFTPGIPNPVHLDLGALSWVATVGALILGLAAPAVLSIASLFVRYRSATDLQRTQLRWIFWALTTAFGMLLLSWAALLFGGDAATGVLGVVSQVMTTIASLSYVLIPLSILFAVLRLDLYAIDHVISRTVSYAVITAVVLIGYVAIVVTLSSLVPQLPSVGVAVATLAAAGTFLPLLRSVRRIVDRRFDRAAYDAQKVVDAFGERLRTGADPHATPADLTAAVDEALQPTALGIWTRGT